MSTAGPSAPSVIIDDPAVGTVSWSDASNAGATDNQYATAASTTAISHYLNAQGFGFAIPADATIDGITLGVECKSSGNSIKDYDVFLLKAGAVAGSDGSVGTWSTTEATRSYGGAAAMWGTTWTPAEVNAADFGCVIAVEITSASLRTASVDYITITVTYTEAAGTAAKQSRSLLGVGW